MKIENNILKHYLKNVYFITGTAYAGKSTAVKMLSERYGLVCCGENYRFGKGGVGTAGSANIGDRYAMFEAIHGTAPRMMEAGLGDYADPRSILNALVMLLRHIGCGDKAACLQAALDTCPCRITGTKDGETCASYVERLIATCVF